MKKILSLAIPLSILAFTACKTSKDLTKCTTYKSAPVSKISMSQGYVDNPIDYTVDSAFISGDTLALKINCKATTGENKFEVIGSNLYMKSLPMQIRLGVKHTFTGKQLEKQQSSWFRYDISPIKPKGNDKLLIVHIPGLKESIKYNLK